ncbi:MAG: type II secretion system GspH family protein [Lentisphaerales bacterium]|nr:type II secretion system GspH family protein [Lentisphaerales bacterium]
MKRKFTLLELLVVIAIMGILMTILLPKLRQARETARIAVCGSNMKQMNVALSLYVKDNKGRVPPRWSSVCSWVGNPGTHNYYKKYTVSKKYLNKYLGYHNDTENVAMATCPSANFGGVWSKTYGTDYYANNGFSANNLTSTAFMAKVKDPTRMISLYEGGAWYQFLSKTPWSNLEHHDQKLGRYNIAFTDGHVSFMHSILRGSKHGESYTFNNEL